MTEDEMVGWDHRLDRRESEQAPGVCDWQGNLVCCSPWVTKSQTGLSDWTKLILHCITNQKASLIVYSDTKFHLWSGLSCPVAWGILVPWPGAEPISPALEGGFLTTGPPGKSLKDLFIVKVCFPFHTINQQVFAEKILSHHEDSRGDIDLPYIK